MTRKKRTKMKGKPEVIAVLNEAVRLEMIAILQYVANVCRQENRGFAKMAKRIMKNARAEMKHLDRFIERVEYLEGKLEYKLDYVTMPKGNDFKQQLENDLAGEYASIDAYSLAIDVCNKAGDVGSAELFTEILQAEEVHANMLEEQLSVINNVGLENYLVEQVG
jgi:bacterioferritin